MAVCNVANILIYDEPWIYDEELSDSMSDEEMDIDEWDASYYSCLAYALGDVRKVQEFWYWYVEKVADLSDKDITIFEKKEYIAEHNYSTVDTVDDFMKVLNADYEYES